MRQRTYISLAFIILLGIFAGWLALSNPTIQLGDAKREVKVHLGLDLQGGMRVLLQADLPEGAVVTPEQIEVARGIIDKRVNALGVSEPLIQVQGTNRIVVELPGIEDSAEAVKAFGNTGLLEFVDAGSTPLQPGTVVQTTGPSAQNSCAQVATNPTPTPTVAASDTISPTNPVTDTNPVTASQVFTTVMTGDCLSSATVSFEPNTNTPVIEFELRSAGAEIFGNHTTNHVGSYLAIVLDKRVISSPVINSAITGGRGVIQGSFTIPEANSLAVQLKYGSLPIPLRIETTTNIGPTLGQESIQRSLLAGIIGVAIVAFFMIAYYRMPGVLAVIALTIYGFVVFAIYKVGIPGIFEYVTLTLAGIAGFILSLGVAVDGNILIFERMKEELREGRPLGLAIEAGFERAWPSIRDSNASTLITSAILLWFGSSFGASIVAGFAITLMIGVVIGLFTSVFVTRTFLRVVYDLFPNIGLWWYGVGSLSRRGSNSYAPTAE
ncbi:MAG: protein translocase subunit SecD [Chloroflexota bacterium]|nr:MAG: protein translocase subunit SecD [Chloroflexota bacterium]